MPEGIRLIVSLVIGAIATTVVRGGKPFKGKHASRFNVDLVVLVILSIITYSILGSYTSAPSHTSNRIPSRPEGTNASVKWLKCADENLHCSFSGTHEVRYGAAGRYFTKTITDGVSCNNAVFGDPIEGTVKACEFNQTSEHDESDNFIQSQKSSATTSANSDEAIEKIIQLCMANTSGIGSISYWLHPDGHLADIHLAAFAPDAKLVLNKCLSKKLLNIKFPNMNSQPKLFNKIYNGNMGLFEMRPGLQMQLDGSIRPQATGTMKQVLGLIYDKDCKKLASLVLIPFELGQKVPVQDWGKSCRDILDEVGGEFRAEPHTCHATLNETRDQAVWGHGQVVCGKLALTFVPDPQGVGWLWQGMIWDHAPSPKAKPSDNDPEPSKSVLDQEL